MQELRLLRAGAARPSGLEIYHDRMRATVLDTLTDAARKRLHRRIAEVVGRRAKPDAALVFEHYLGCDAKQEAAHWAVEAAADSEQSMAFSRAAELLGRALDLRALGSGDWPLAARQARAVALAGASVRAAALLEAAARGAEEHRAPASEILQLRAEAARELLCGGAVDDGLMSLRRMVRSAGLRYPRSPLSSLVTLIRFRALLALRGLAFEEKPEAAVAADERVKIDACWVATRGLNSFDAIRSAAFQAQHTLRAVRAGEPHRVARALTAEAVYRAAEGGQRGRGRAEILLREVEMLAGRLDDPHTTAFAHLCAGVSFYFATRWSDAVASLEASERVLGGLPGVAWETTMCRMYRLWAHAWKGDAITIAREQDIALRSAETSEDWLEGTAAASGHANLRWLFEDDAGEARRRCTQAISRFPPIGFQSPHLADLLAQTRVDLYEGDAWAAWSRLVAAAPRVRASLLLRLQLFRIESLHLRALAALAAAAQGPGPAHLRRWSAAKLRSEAAGCALRLRKEDLAMATALAASIEAALASGGAARSRLLESAGRGFEASGMVLHAAAARSGLGEAYSDAEAGVRSLARLSRVLVPAPR